MDSSHGNEEETLIVKMRGGIICVYWIIDLVAVTVDSDLGRGLRSRVSSLIIMCFNGERRVDATVPWKPNN